MGYVLSHPKEDGACEDCFSVLSREQINRLLVIGEASSIGAYCDLLLNTPNSCQESEDVVTALKMVPGITPEQVGEIFECLVNTGAIDRECV